jgi:hypothetical protein
MWTYEKALRVVAAYVEASTEGSGVVLESQTIDKPYGWVFFYEARAFVESGNVLEAFAGNAPLIFNRTSGEYHVTGTARLIDDYIAEYERTLPPLQLQMKPQLRRR